MKTLLVFGMLMLPPTVFAAEDCQVVEFPDHFEVTCTGDAKPVPIPRQAVTQAPMQEAVQPQDQEQHVPPQSDSSAGSQSADPAKPPAPGSPYVRTPGRQGRPSSADMNAAIEARRRLIEQLRPQSQPVTQ